MIMIGVLPAPQCSADTDFLPGGPPAMLTPADLPFQATSYQNAEVPSVP